MTTLDHRLYAWLIECDERRFERAFNAYFSVAFPAVVRHLARLSRWDPAQLEELAQDALLKFFDRVGRGRREASETVRISLVRIRPLNPGAFHARQVSVWTKDVSSFRDAAMGFDPGPLEESRDTQWKASIRALADRIPLLQRQGCHLLHAVYVELHWSFDGEDSRNSRREELDQQPFIDSLEGKSDDEVGAAGPRDIAERLARELGARTARAQVAEERHPGVTQFVDATFTVVGAIPQLRVPTNGYLFEIAMTIYLDECKKRQRQKRGGGVSEEVQVAGNRQSPPQHPIELMTLDPAIEFDAEEPLGEDLARPANDSSTRTSVVPANDPTRQYEHEEFLEKFYQYLRRPVNEATEAYQKAQSVGRAIAERRKLESLSGKFARTISVLGMMGEGYTQEQTAQRLGLSRNQVKYAVELLQEAYAKFAGAMPG
jgi:DNA-directed RNA polymerase specialized sigma24 family protein